MPPTPRRPATACRLAAALALAGCQALVDDAVGRGIGQACSSDDQCQGGFCNGTCAARCATTADCPAPLTCGPGGVCAEPELRVGFIWAGAYTDQSSVAKAHEKGIAYAQRELPYLRTEVAPESFLPALATQAVDRLVGGGAQIIVNDSYAQLSSIRPALSRYPDVRSAVATTDPVRGYPSYAGREYQDFYAAGFLAAQVSKRKRLGFVGSFPTPVVVRNINAFAQGARRFDPEAKVEVAWLGFWFDLDGPDPVTGKLRDEELVEALLASGCDVIGHYAVTDAVNRAVDRARTAGVDALSLGIQVSDVCDALPSSCLASIRWNWGPVFVRLFTAYRRNEWDPTLYVNEPITDDPERSITYLKVNGTLAGPGPAAKTSQLRSLLTSPEGVRLPWNGPYCSTGQRTAGCVEAGQTLSDDELKAMCWFVEGVVERPVEGGAAASDVPAQVPRECTAVE